MSNRYTEKYLIRKVKFVRELKQDDFIEFFSCGKESNEDGDKIYWADIYKKHKKFANDLIESEKDYRKVTYVSKKKCDRKYAQQFGFQSMPRRLRAFYARDNYDDVDIVNSAGNILYYIATNELGIEPSKITTLKDYSTNPKGMRTKYNLEKNDMFKYYFNDTCKGKNSWTKQFANECRILQEEVWDKQLAYDIEAMEDDKKNPKGSYCSCVYFKYETQINEKAMDMVGHHNIGAPIHDGFLIDKTSTNIGCTLDEINDALPTSINYIHKPFEDDYPELTEAYENYEEEDISQYISFKDIDDEWFVEQFFINYKEYFRVDDDDNIYVKEDCKWKLDSKKKSVYCKAVELVRELKKNDGYKYMNETDAKAFKRYNNHNTINAFSNKVKNLMSVYVDEFDEETGNYLFFTNGYYNLSHKKFYNKFDKYNLWSYEFDYNPNHEYDGFEFDKILNDCTGDNYDLFLKYLLCALNGVNIKKMLYLIGLGNNGKSVIVDTLRIAFKEISHKCEGDIFGYDLSVNKPRADLLGLKNKRMVWCSEPSEGNLKAPTIKALTGGDSITCRKLHSNDTIEFKSNFLFMIAANKPVNLEDVDEAVLNRFLFMEMKSKFVSNPREGIMEEKQANPYYLSDKFQESQREHILHWLVNLHEKEDIDFSKYEFNTVETETLRMDMKEDTSEAILYVETNTVDCVGECIELSRLYNSFKADNPTSFLSKTKFNKDLRTMYKVTRGTVNPYKNKNIIKHKKLLEVEFFPSDDMPSTHGLDG